MHQTSIKDQPTVLRVTTGDPYHDIGRYMPSDRVREADADWLKWREDARLAIKGIDSALNAAESAVSADLKGAPSSGTINPPQAGREGSVSATEADALLALIQVQRDACEVAKAHLAVAIDGQEKAGKQGKEDRARADAGQRQARISNYFGAGGFLVGVLGVLYGILSR